MTKKEKELRDKVKDLEDLVGRLSNRCFLKQEIQEQLTEHNLDEPTVLGLADDIYLLDEIRALGLN
jgi:hypothetical protein